MESYIINRMYAGSYLDKNIGGGEAINLLHADDGVNYCFINPYGTFSSEYNDSVQAVIHTRFCEVGCFEVIGVSVLDSDSQLIHPKGNKKADREKCASEQLREYTKSHPIRYGGVPYLEEDGIYASITFKSARLLYPTKQIFILDSEYGKEISDSIVTYKLEDKRFGRQPLHMMVDDQKTPSAFTQIEQMIADEELWEERITKIDDVQFNNHFNFLTLIKKEDDELAFSNMFGYFFSTFPNLFVEFARDFLKAEISEGYVVKREHHNIDLWIEDDDDVIVIENKVKSGINGVSPRHDFSKDGLVQSQLLKYYQDAHEYAIAKNKRESYFLFVPNYNHLDLSQYAGSKHYKVIRYGDIYRYLVSKSVKSPYYGDFCKALYKHTKDVPVDYSEDLANHLIRDIERKKKKILGT